LVFLLPWPADHRILLIRLYYEELPNRLKPLPLIHNVNLLEQVAR
jgi:hypothetical protein